MTTASGIWRARELARRSRPAWRVERRHDVPGPRAEHVAADDRRELDRPDEAGRQPRRRRLEERRARTGPSPAGTGRTTRDEDALAVDEQVGQVVGDEVADGDRQQAGAGRATPTIRVTTRAAATTMPEEAEQHAASSARAPADAEQVEARLRLGQPVEEDRADAEGDDDDIGRSPAGLEQAAGERSPADAARPRRPGANAASRPSSRNQTVNTSPCERHASRPNWAIIARRAAPCSRRAR